jgi:ribosome-binding protein aMBF1 (putative translation factor)
MPSISKVAVSQKPRSQSAKIADIPSASELVFNRFYKDQPEALASYSETCLEEETACLLRELRQKAGLTQKDLAEKLQTSIPAISRMENPNYGIRSLKKLHHLAAIFNCRIKIELVPANPALEQETSSSKKN